MVQGKKTKNKKNIDWKALAQNLAPRRPLEMTRVCAQLCGGHRSTNPLGCRLRTPQWTFVVCDISLGAPFRPVRDSEAWDRDQGGKRRSFRRKHPSIQPPLRDICCVPGPARGSGCSAVMGTDKAPTLRRSPPAGSLYSSAGDQRLT